MYTQPAALRARLHRLASSSPGPSVSVAAERLGACWVLEQADDCTNVRVRGLIATAPNNSPNTDGMNFYGGYDQSIVDSVRDRSPLLVCVTAIV